MDFIPNLSILSFCKSLLLFQLMTLLFNWQIFFPGTFKLYPNENSIPNLKKDYKNMKQMIFGDSPSFEEVLSVIKKLEEEINDLGKKI